MQKLDVEIVQQGCTQAVRELLVPIMESVENESINPARMIALILAIECNVGRSSSDFRYHDQSMMSYINQESDRYINSCSVLFDQELKISQPIKDSTAKTYMEKMYRLLEAGIERNHPTIKDHYKKYYSGY
jgi:hypothetical protein